MALKTGTTLGRIRTTGRRIVTAAATTALTASVLTTLAVASATPAAADPAPPDHLVISAFYGDGGNSGATYTYDFVELYNPTDAAISLGTISGSTVTPDYDLCYRSVNGNTCTTVKLYGTVLAHHHFLIRAQKGSGTGSAADVTPDLDLSTLTSDPSGQQANNMAGSTTGGQVLLLDAATTGGSFGNVDNTSNRNLADSSINPSKVVDALGYGTTGQGASGGGAEGWVSTTQTHAAAVGTSADWELRTFVDGIPQDTNDNAADFTVGTRAPISQVTSRVTAGTVGDATLRRAEAMSPVTVAASEGIAPYTFSATGLPAGVTIDPSTGVVSGTPAGSDDLTDYPVTVTVSDSTPGTPDTASTSFTLKVTDAAPTLAVDAPADASVDQGAALTPISVHATGGTPPLTFAATGLPAGVSIDSSTGVISGTPTGDAETYDVHVTVSDSAAGGPAQSAAADFTLTVNPAAPGNGGYSPPAAGDALAQLKLNEVETTGTPADDWVELYNTGAALTGVGVHLADAAGKVYPLPAQDVAAHGYVVVEGADLDAAGIDLSAGDTLYLTESDDHTLLDQATWTAYAPTSLARTTDGSGDFATSAYPTKGTANAGAPAPLKPFDLFVSEVNNDVTGTDYYEYLEVTNTTSHPIDFSAYGIELRYGASAYLTFHRDGSTIDGSPVIDPVIPAHGTQLFWSVNTAVGSDAYWQKTDANFRSFYGLAASVPLVQVFGQNGLSNGGNTHYYVVQGPTTSPTVLADSYVPAEASAANNNSAEHYAVAPSGTAATLWHDSYGLGQPLITPGTVDPEQVGYGRVVKVNEVHTAGDASSDWVELYNTSADPVDVSGYVLGNKAGSTYTVPAGSTIAAKGYLVVRSSDSGLDLGDDDSVALSAPRVGYAYTDGSTALDTVSWTQAPRSGADWGRVPDGSASISNVTPSPGAANVAFNTFVTPAAGDPLAQLTINEVKATGTPADDWIELYNKGDALANVTLHLQDLSGTIFAGPEQDIAAHGFTVIEGADLGFTLEPTDTLFLTETDDRTLLDQVSWTSYAPTSLARTTDGAGIFATSAYPTKGAANSGAPGPLSPNDLLVSEVNYDNASTDYYEYIEVTNTTSHPIDFSAYGVTLRYGTATPSSAVLTFHSDGDTVAGSPVVDPVIAARGTQIFWSVNTAAGNDAYWQKTDANFRSFYGLAGTVPIVQVFGQNGLANTGARYYEMFQSSTPLSSAFVPATNASYSGNYAAHFALPADRTSPTAAMWFDANAHAKQYVTPGTVDLEQVGYTRAVKIIEVDDADDSVKLSNTSAGPLDLSGYVLQSNEGQAYTLPAGTTVAGNADVTISGHGSDLALAAGDWVTLLAPRGYAYADGNGIVDTSGPFLHSLPYDANSGQAPVIDPTTGLPLPPAGGLYRPAGVSALNGTVYASNTGDNLLAAMADGSNTVIAGALDRYGFDLSQDGGAAANASLYQPGGTAVDTDGNVYIADSGDNVVLKISKADGTIHLVAGTGTAGGAAAAFTGASTATAVTLYRPESVAVAANGDLYIADTYDNRIVKVTPAGVATVVAGTGQPGYTGDGAAATAGTLSQPAGVAVDSEGNVYIADSSNNVIRRVDARTGVITTVAGDYAADQANNSCLGAYAGDGGPATSAQLNDPQGIALDGAGDLFIADTFNNAIREVTPDGAISTIVNVGATAGSENTSPVGSGSVPGNTRLNTPYAVTVDAATHALYIADTRNSAIAEVLHVAEAGAGAGPLEPADQIAVTGSGAVFAACSALVNPPVITAISPPTDLRTGGTTVTITGSHFTGTTGVMFGSVAGTGVTVIDDSHLTVISPAHAVGRVEVTVTNVAGDSISAPADQFTYLPLVPVITKISPASGPTTGKTIVTLTGSHFTGTTGVKFGTVAGTGVTVVDDSHLRVTSPAHAPGRVEVTVTNAEGASISASADAFTYLSIVPVISRISPTSGLITGGTTVTITGRHFTGTTLVRFGTAAGTRVKVTDDAHLRVSSPRHSAGRVDVTVTSAGGRSAIVAADRFTFTTPACTYIADYAKLTRARAKLTKDERALASAKATLKKTHRAKTRAALHKKIAALDRTITADRRAVAAALKVARAEGAHGWCRNQVAAQNRLSHAQAKLAKDEKALAGAKATLKKTHRARARAALHKKIAALGRTIAADKRVVAADLRALKAAH